MVLQKVWQKAKDLQEQYHNILEKSDFSIPTFLAFGAALQLLSFSYLPTYLSVSLPLLWLGYRLMRSSVESRDVFKTSFKDVMRGKFSAQLPDPSDGVVVFILGSRLNHPFGKLAPGTIPLDVVFKDIWREAEENREKWGFLGRTATLADASDTVGTTTVWITYWKSIKGLHEFAASGAHRLGQMNHEAGKYPYVGIMHELYHAPNGSYESVYENFRPWGLGTAKDPVTKGDSGLKLPNTLALLPEGTNMYTRMRKNARNK